MMVIFFPWLFLLGVVHKGPFLSMSLVYRILPQHPNRFYISSLITSIHNLSAYLSFFLPSCYVLSTLSLCTLYPSIVNAQTTSACLPSH